MCNFCVITEKNIRPSQIEGHSIKCPTSTFCQGHKNQGETEPVTALRKLRRQDDKMQSGILDWILEQKDTNGETGEIQKKSGV